MAMFDKRVELDTGVRIKNKDLGTIKYYLNQLSNGLLSYTKKENEVAILKRESDIRRKQIQLLQGQYNNLKVKAEEMSTQLSDIKVNGRISKTKFNFTKKLTKNLGLKKLAPDSGFKAAISSKVTMRDNKYQNFGTFDNTINFDTKSSEMAYLISEINDLRKELEL